MGEYLDGLPYQSQIMMSLDQDDWTRMGVGEQQAIIDDVKSKIAPLSALPRRRRPLGRAERGRRPGDGVYPVPIDVLP